MRSSYPETRGYWPAYLFTAGMIALALLSLSTLNRVPVLGAGTELLEDGSQRLTWIMPGGYGYEAGLRSGDVVRLLPPPTGSPAWGAVQVVQGGRAGETLPLVRRWPSISDLVLFGLGLEFLLAGLIVYRAATDRPAAHRFAVLSGACAAVFVAFPAIGNGHPWALALEWFGSKMAMAAFALFFLTTPVRRWKALHPALLWLPVPILTLYSYSVLARPDLYALVKPLGYSYMAFGLTVSLLAMVWPFVTRSPREQRRLWPVLLGSGLAAALYLLASMLPYLLFRRYLLPAEIAIGGLTLLPLGFLWAMLRYPFMGMTLGPWAVVKTVFETITDPIFVVGRDGQLIDASRSGLALLGIDRIRQAREPFEQMATRRLAVDSEQGVADRSLVARVLAGELVRDEEYPILDPSGRTLYVSIVGTPLFNESGQVDMAVLVCRDITERKRREEEQRELDRQKDDFLASISHDLKTPLTAIKSSVGVVLANEPVDTPEPLHRMLVNVDLAADRMDSMVEDLLEMARLQAGRVRLRLDRCSLRELALRAAATVEPLAAARHQRMELEIPSERLPATVDAGRLERALTNLLSNAQRYGRAGGTIRLSLRQRQGEVLFAVADDGPGIPEGEQQRIFDRFYRMEREPNGAGGSGLGLPIARAMAELHGGRLWVESKPDTGSTFWLSIPTGQESQEPPQEGQVGRSSEQPRGLPEIESHEISEGVSA